MLPLVTSSVAGSRLGPGVKDVVAGVLIGSCDWSSVLVMVPPMLVIPS